jgi:hypothetical protein
MSGGLVKGGLRSMIGTDTFFLPLATKTTKQTTFVHMLSTNTNSNQLHTLSVSSPTMDHTIFRIF